MMMIPLLLPCAINSCGMASSVVACGMHHLLLAGRFLSRRPTLFLDAGWRVWGHVEHRWARPTRFISLGDGLAKSRHFLSSAPVLLKTCVSHVGRHTKDPKIIAFAFGLLLAPFAPCCGAAAAALRPACLPFYCCCLLDGDPLVG